jgi:hypothetical protein
VQTVATALEDPCLEIGKVLERVIRSFGWRGTSLDFFVEEEIAYGAVEEEMAEVISDGEVDLVAIVSKMWNRVIYSRHTL